AFAFVAFALVAFALVAFAFVAFAFVAFALVVVLAWGTVVRGRLLAALTLCSGGRSLVASVRVALLRFVVLRVARRGGGPGRLLARLLGRLLGRRRGLGGAGLGVGRLRGRRRRGARGLLGRRLAVAAGLRRRRRPLCRRPFRRRLLGATLLGVVLDGHDLSRLDRRILEILDRPLVLDQRGCIVRHRGHLVGGRPIALDAAGTVAVGGIGRCGESGGRERDGESGGTCAGARTQSHIGSVPPLRGALARRRSVTSVAGP